MIATKQLFIGAILWENSILIGFFLNNCEFLHMLRTYILRFLSMIHIDWRVIKNSIWWRSKNLSFTLKTQLLFLTLLYVFERSKSFVVWSSVDRLVILILPNILGFHLIL